MTDKILVLTNCGSQEEASKIARALVESGLAACVNILPGVQSVYTWKAAIEVAPEWTLLIKTRRDMFEDVAAQIRKLHSYDLPEVVAVPIVAGLEAYLDWIDSGLTAPPRSPSD